MTAATFDCVWQMKEMSLSSRKSHEHMFFFLNRLRAQHLMQPFLGGDYFTGEACYNNFYAPLTKEILKFFLALQVLLYGLKHLWTPTTDIK